MPYLSPPALTTAEQSAILQATAAHPRDHLILSLALGTGLRLGDIVGLNVSEEYKRAILAAAAQRRFRVPMR